MDTMERFLRKTEMRDGHRIWTASTTGSGAPYGVFYVNGRQVYAHRWIYEQCVGPIPDGYEIDHKCRQKLCTSVECLEAVTHTENMRRMRLTVCRRGLHDLTKPENVQFDNQGRRRGCRPCNRRASRDWLAAHPRRTKGCDSDL